MKHLLLLALLAFSPLAAETKDIRFLTISGEGQVAVKATIADVQVSILVQRETAREAQDELATKLKPVYDKLQSLKAEKLETSTVGIYQVHDKDDAQKILGYKGVATLQFAADPTNAGLLIDAAIAAGATEINNVTLRPSKENLEEAQSQALVLACNQAMHKAVLILKTLKLENKGILEVSADPQPIPFARGYAMAKASPQLEITEQDQMISASIQLKIEID